MNKPQPILHQIGNIQIADYGETTNATFGDKPYPKYTLFVNGVNWYYVFGNFPFAGLELMRDFELMKTFADGLQKRESTGLIEKVINENHNPNILESMYIRSIGLTLEKLLVHNEINRAATINGMVVTPQYINALLELGI